MILMSRALAVLSLYVMLYVPLCGSERALDQKSGAQGLILALSQTFQRPWANQLIIPNFSFLVLKEIYYYSF